MKLQYSPLIFLITMLAGGCLAHRKDAYNTTMKIDAASRDQLWNAAQEVLRDYRFRLDRLDRQAGVISTLPLGSKHFFEVWRKDVATREDSLESTVNPIRRWVEVFFTPGEGQSWSAMEVVVHKERLSARDRQFNSSTAAYQYFGNTLPATTGEIRPGDLAEKWIELGRDGALEELLLRKISEQAASPAEARG
jgi:hypothetical protein